VKETKKGKGLNFYLNTMDVLLAVLVLETVTVDKSGGTTIKRK
jgi:hypothetical protein